MFGRITVFDEKKFVESGIARKLGLDEIVAEARAEIRQTESRSIRAPGSMDHARCLRILVIFLRDGVRPAGLSDDGFQALLPLAQHLIDRGDLKPDILELFGAAPED